MRTPAIYRSDSQLVLTEEQTETIVELYRLYVAIGRQPTLSALVNLCESHFGVTVGHQALAKRLRRAGIYQRRSVSLETRVGSDLIETTARRYSAGEISLPQVAEALGCQLAVARRWMRIMQLRADLPPRELENVWDDGELLEMVAERRAGRTYREIGLARGVTRERARQLIEKARRRGLTQEAV